MTEPNAPEPKPVDPMTDEQIASIVDLVAAAEKLATVLGVSVARGAEIMLKTVRVMGEASQKPKTLSETLMSLATMNTKGVQ